MKSRIFGLVLATFLQTLIGEFSVGQSQSPALSPMPPLVSFDLGRFECVHICLEPHCTSHWFASKNFMIHVGDVIVLRHDNSPTILETSKLKKIDLDSVSANHLRMADSRDYSDPAFNAGATKLDDGRYIFHDGRDVFFEKFPNLLSKQAPFGWRSHFGSIYKFNKSKPGALEKVFNLNKFLGNDNVKIHGNKIHGNWLQLFPGGINFICDDPNFSNVKRKSARTTPKLQRLLIREFDTSNMSFKRPEKLIWYYHGLSAIVGQEVVVFNGGTTRPVLREYPYGWIGVNQFTGRGRIIAQNRPECDYGRTYFHDNSVWSTYMCGKNRNSDGQVRSRLQKTDIETGRVVKIKPPAKFYFNEELTFAPNGDLFVVAERTKPGGEPYSWSDLERVIVRVPKGSERGTKIATLPFPPMVLGTWQRLHTESYAGRISYRTATGSVGMPVDSNFGFIQADNEYLYLSGILPSQRKVLDKVYLRPAVYRMKLTASERSRAN